MVPGTVFSLDVHGESMTDVLRHGLRRGPAHALLCLVLAWAASCAWAVDLSASERAYLQQLGPVSFCVDPDWPPFEGIDQAGQYVGIAADLLALVAQRTGVPLTLLATRDWPESIAASQAGRCQVLGFLNQTPARQAWLVFTQPVLTDNNVLITREEHPFIVDLASLSNRTMALPKGTSIEERVRREFPNVQLLLTDTEAQALAMVSDRRADMTMRSLIVAAHTIKHEGWFNLKIAGQVPGFENQLRIGVGKAHPRLRDILDRGVASITAQERSQIVDRHIAIQVTTPVDYTLLKLLAAGLAVVLLTSVFWIRQLRTLNAALRVQSRTDTLTGLLNRTSLDVSFPQEMERARRSGLPLSVVMLDIDFFKRINDELGHLMGDKVLREMAQILRQQVRGVDTVCRWGGEEFLVICPQASAAQAATLAERILQAVRGHSFASQRPHTLSAGVTAWQPGESSDSLFQRADDALYQAKHAGRDRVVVRP